MRVQMVHVLIISLLFAVVDAIGQTYYLVDKSYSGIEDFEVTPGMEAKASEIDQLIPGFKVYGYDFYPILAYEEQSLGYDKQLSDVISERAADDAHLLIIKEHQEQEQMFEYRVSLKLPSAGNHSHYNQLERQTIENLILQELRNVAMSFEYDLSYNSLIEIAGMEKLVSILSGEPLPNIYRNSDFEAIPIDSTVAGLAFSGVVDDSHAYYKDYAGTTLNDDQGTSTSLLGLLQSHAITTAQFGFVITSSGHPVDVDQVNGTYEGMDAKIVLWMHFDVGNPATAGDTLYVKVRNTFSYVEAEGIFGDLYEAHMNEYIETDLPDDINPSTAVSHARSTGDCSLSFKWGYNCLVIGGTVTPTTAFPEFGIGLVAGLLDGLLGTIEFAYNVVGGGLNIFQKIYKGVTDYVESLYAHYLAEQTFVAVLKKIKNDAVGFIKKVSKDIIATYNTLKVLVEGASVTEIAVTLYNAVVEWMGDTFSSGINAGYFTGTIAFEAILVFFTGGTSAFKSAAKDFMPKILEFAKELGSPKGLSEFVKNKLFAAENTLASAGRAFKCKILGAGCFVENTPVLMAGNTQNYPYNVVGNTAKGLALAAAMPIVAVPIQDVQLFDYAVAHKTIYSSYGLTASALEKDTYSSPPDKDPYTSDQQRERDQYELDDENWNEVVFEELYGLSIAKMALHNDCIKQKGYSVDAVVNMNLPEQGILGPFRITSIKHILPQKKPVDEDEADDYDYRPVTALFTHRSDQVYEITFDNEETVGVTYQHPIYSLTAGDWRLAGELEVGEKVLTKAGESIVTISEEKEGVETVYNLEVKELHNFLVGESEVVVHNACASIVAKVKKMTPTQLQQHIDDGWSFVIESSDDVVEFFRTRRYFEELMVAYRYTKNGLKSTNPIAHNFRSLDAFKETSRTVVNGITEITSSLAVSMKTTKVSNVSQWLTSNSSHLDDLAQGLSQGIQWAGHKINYSSVRLDIYMPKDVYSAAKKIEWESYIENLYPSVKVNVSRLEDHVKNL